MRGSSRAGRGVSVDRATDEATDAQGDRRYQGHAQTEHQPALSEVGQPTERPAHPLADVLRDWDAEAGPVDDEAVAAMAKRYDL